MCRNSAAARGVDDVRPRPQGREGLLADEPAGLRGEGHVDRERVGPPAGLDHRGGPGRAEGGRVLRGEAPGVDAHLHPEGARPGDDLAPDGAGADDGELAPEEAAGAAEGLLGPPPLPEGRDLVGQAPVEGEQVGEGELGHGDGVLAGAVGHEDAAARGGVEVDGVDAGPRADDQAEGLAGRELSRLDLGRADDEHLGGEGRERGGEGLAGEPRRHGDVVAALPEALGQERGELVRDEDLHEPSLRRRAGAARPWGR